jgi:hypothetical protein
MEFYMASESQTMDIAKLKAIHTAHEVICTLEAGALTEALNNMPNLEKLSINDFYVWGPGQQDQQKLLMTAIKTGKLVPLLQSKMAGTIDLSGAQGLAVTNFAMQKLKEFMDLKTLKLPDGSMRLIGDLPVTTLYGPVPQVNFISMAAEQNNLKAWLDGGTGTIDISAPVTSTTKEQLLDPSLAVKALCHKQFPSLSSEKVTGTMSLETPPGIICTYYAIVMNAPGQLEDFIKSPKVTGQLDINTMVDTSPVVQGIKIPTPSHPLISYAAFHNCLGPFLTSLRYSDKDAGSPLDLGVKIPDSDKLIIEKLRPEDREIILDYATRELLHITCRPAKIQTVQAKLEEFGFGGYLRLQFRNNQDEVINTATSKDPKTELTYYAVKAPEIAYATEKYLKYLKESHLDIDPEESLFCFLAPSLNPEQVTIEKLMSDGHTEVEARGILGDWGGYDGPAF